MCREYNVQLDDSIVGTAKVIKEGLYLHIICICKFVDEGVYKIEAKGPCGTVNLGTCVQSRGTFGLDTRVPYKHIGIDGLIFRVAVSKGDKTQILVPVSEGEAFPYIAQLQNARLSIQNGKHFIELKN